MWFSDAEYESQGSTSLFWSLFLSFPLELWIDRQDISSWTRSACCHGYGFKAVMVVFLYRCFFFTFFRPTGGCSLCNESQIWWWMLDWTKVAESEGSQFLQAAITALEQSPRTLDLEKLLKSRFLLLIVINKNIKAINPLFFTLFTSVHCREPTLSFIIISKIINYRLKLHSITTFQDIWFWKEAEVSSMDMVFSSLQS